jgi:hypothetical protein
MKKLILIAIFTIISSNIFAKEVLTNWYDMEVYQRYTLRQDIVFENGMSFKAGEQFDMFDFISGGVPNAYFGLHQVNCKNPYLTADLSIVEVPTKPKIQKIGAQLAEGCNLELYVELRDFFKDSIFTVNE